MKTEKPFEHGDVVYLNSGSPKLTITDVRDSGTKITVAWIDQTQSVQSSTFPSDCLTRTLPE